MFTQWLQKMRTSHSFPQFLVLMSFLITFAITRLITHLQKANFLPNSHGLAHIHHLVPGIFLLLISGYIGISYWQIPRWRNITAILFGIGAALTIDEFALWLYLRDVYWEKQGRDSVDAFIIIAVILGISYVLNERPDNHIGRWIENIKNKLQKS